MATSYQAPTIHSLTDLLDCVGWAAWGDLPEFSYNPMTTSAVLVSIVKLGASAQQAIKILMVAESWIAFVSMALLYRTTRRSATWALVAGLFYALLPATALQISGDLDLGFCVALAPLALAAGLRLTRRFGYFGLPLAGAICGFAGQGFATEYLLIVSLPALALVALEAYRPGRLVAWLVATCAGVFCAVGVGLYCILPTFASDALLTSPAARIAESEGGGVLALFGETITALWHGVLTESMLSPVSEFNVSSLLWSTSIAFTILWGAALTFAARRFRRGGAGRRQALAIALLLLLAFGSALPFAATFWDVVGHVSFLQFLRTPDRLVVVPLVSLVWWGVAMLQSLARRQRRQNRAARRFALGALFAIGASFAFFDLGAGTLIVRESLDFRLPGLRATNAAALKRPGPLAAYTFVNAGSVFDTPLYGAGVPTRIIAQDLISRFGAGPGHALGMLRKAGIRTIVTTPLWAEDSGAWPDLGAAYATSRRVRNVSGSASSAAVWSVRDPVPDVSSTGVACLHGGPGILDEISLVPVVKNFAFVAATANCALDIYANADPRDETLRQAIRAWPAVALFPGRLAHDSDYPFVTTRTLLARPWYRDAIDGDTPVFGEAAVTTGAASSPPLTAEVPSSGVYVAELRGASAGSLCLGATVDAKAKIERCAAGGYGLHWLPLPIALTKGRHRIVFSVRPGQSVPANPLFLDGIALAGKAVSLRPPVARRPQVAIYSLPWATVDAGLRPLWIAAGRYRAGWFAADGSFVGDRLFVDGRRAPREIVLARSGFHRITGNPPGAYLLAFVGSGVRVTRPAEPVGSRRSAASWDVRLAARGTVRATVLDDRSWSLDGEQRHFDGFDCDLVDTCFASVPPGRYVLRHRWPAAIVAGLLATALVWCLAAAPCIVVIVRRRRLRLRRSPV
jgi:hypothetical protein